MRRGLALLLACGLLLAGIPAWAAGESSTDVSGADIVIGYVAANNAMISPFVCNEWDLVSMNQLVFEPLVALDDNQRPTPMLADNWTHEGNVWVFTLRNGVSFHNGETLTANDVVISYQAFERAGDRNPYYSRIHAFIDDMVAVDNRTVAVRMKGPGYLAIYAMTFPVVAASTVFDDMPRGTGPYWYVEYNLNQSIRIEANPLWWQVAPSVGSIAFQRYSSSAAALEAIQLGSIDMLSTHSSTAAVFRKMAAMHSMDYGTMTFEMLVPNGTSSVMSSRPVRQAVMYAIDRAVLGANAYLEMGVQSEVPVLPGTWLYESQSAMYYYSPERALYMLHSDGWRDLTGDGRVNKLNGIHVLELSVRIITYNETGNAIRQNAANMIAEYLSAVGMRPTVEVLTKKQVRNRISNGNYDLALVGVNVSEIPSLQQLVSASGPLNYNGYADGTMEALLQATTSAGTAEDLQKAFGQAEIYIAEQLPVMGLLFRTGVLLSRVPIGELRGIRALHSYRGIEYLKP